MKTTILILAGMILSVPTAGWAQYATIGSQPQTPVFVGSASTADESYMRGQGELQRAHGAWMVNASQAMVNYEEACRRHTENQLAATKAYFQLREENRRNREAERSRPIVSTPYSARAAASARPAARALFNPIKDGRIAWPESLESESFSAGRARFEGLYVQRAAGHELSLADREALEEIQKTMLAELKRCVPNMGSHDYFVALTFVKSLSSSLVAVDSAELLAGR